MSLIFKPEGVISHENMDRLMRASTGFYMWKSWCTEMIAEANENWPIVQCLYDRENLVIKVVEINSYLFYIPQIPVENLLADCQVTGNYEETVTKIEEFYKEVVLLTAERLKRYQAIFSSFVEFALK